MKSFVPVFFAVFFLIDRVACQSYSPDRIQTINNIFEIPIQTLNAIKRFVQGTRPISSLIRNPQQQQQQQQRPALSSSSSSYPSYSNLNYNYNLNTNRYRSRAARIAGLYTAADGSGFKI